MLINIQNEWYIEIKITALNGLFEFCSYRIDELNSFTSFLKTA